MIAWIVSRAPAMIAGLLLAQSGLAQPVPQGITGIFSTLRVSEQSGDIVGVELMVLGSSSGVSVVVQGSEGAPGTPLVLPAALRGSVVQFDVPPSCACGMLQGTYRAEIDEGGITLAGPSGGGARFLPRGDSFWQSRGRR